jgi:hypothetical protein
LTVASTRAEICGSAAIRSASTEELAWLTKSGDSSWSSRRGGRGTWWKTPVIAWRRSADSDSAWIGWNAASSAGIMRTTTGVARGTTGDGVSVSACMLSARVPCGGGAWRRDGRFRVNNARPAAMSRPTPIQKNPMVVRAARRRRGRT